MSETTWDVQDGAIVERPRNVRTHPLLNRIYERHDELIAQRLPPGRTLELAFGQHMHPRADIGLEGWPSNAETVRNPALAGDARALPFDDDTFDVVEKQALGSPLMLASISQSDASARLLALYERTQFVKWWTFVVGEHPEGAVPA